MQDQNKQLKKRIRQIEDEMRTTSEAADERLTGALRKAVEESKAQSQRMQELQLAHASELRELEVQHVQRAEALQRESESLRGELRQARQDVAERGQAEQHNAARDAELEELREQAAAQTTELRAMQDQVDVLVEGAILGAIKQRATVDINKAESVEGLVEQLLTQLVGPNGQADIVLPTGTAVEVFDNNSNGFVPITSLSQLSPAGEAKLRLRLPTTTAPNQDNSDAPEAAAQQHNAALNVILSSTTLLVESIFTSFGECIITSETLDTVIQACAARENGTTHANPADLRAYKAAVLDGYEAAKRIAPRNHVLYELHEKKMELEATVGQLSQLLERQREEADFEHNTAVKALADVRDENEKLTRLVAQLQQELQQRVPPKDVPSVATSSEVVAEVVPDSAPTQEAKEETQVNAEPEPVVATPDVDAVATAAAVEEVPAPSAVIEEVTARSVEPLQPEERQEAAPVSAASAAPEETQPATAEAVVEAQQQQLVLAPAPPAEPNAAESARATRHREVVEEDAGEVEAAPRQLIMCFYNRFDPKLKRTAKLGRTVSVNADMQGATAELKAIVAAAFHEQALDIGYVERTGRRIYITTDEQLAEFVRRPRDGRPVVQCFSQDEALNSIRNVGESPMRIARSPVPPSSHDSSYAVVAVSHINNSTTNNTTVLTSPPRPSSAMSSRCQTPFDYIAGKDLDDRAIEAEFAVLANGEPYVLRDDVIRYLDDKYDNVGIVRRHAQLIDTLFGKIRHVKRDKIRFTFEEFALILLRHSQS